MPRCQARRTKAQQVRGSSVRCGCEGSLHQVDMRPGDSLETCNISDGDFACLPVKCLAGYLREVGAHYEPGHCNMSWAEWNFLSLQLNFSAFLSHTGHCIYSRMVERLTWRLVQPEVLFQRWIRNDIWNSFEWNFENSKKFMAFLSPSSRDSYVRLSKRAT